MIGADQDALTPGFGGGRGTREMARHNSQYWGGTFCDMRERPSQWALKRLGDDHVNNPKDFPLPAARVDRDVTRRSSMPIPFSSGHPEKRSTCLLDRP